MSFSDYRHHQSCACEVCREQSHQGTEYQNWGVQHYIEHATCVFVCILEASVGFCNYVCLNYHCL